jgi:predicted MFS family arabinose efflux permease
LTPADQPASRPWLWVAALWCAYFLHQADKQIYAVLLLPIRESLALSNAEAGLVNTVFTLVVALASPLAGALGDRWPKARVLWIAIAVWSAATSATGLALSLPLLMAARSVATPAAEAFYPPVSHALLADLHSGTRALAISIHQTAQYAGPIASGFLAGWIGERYGWPYAFFVFGSLGLALAAWIALRLPAPDAPRPAGPLLAGFRHCLGLLPVRRIGLAFAGVLFVTVGYSTWAPAIFRSQFGLSLSQAGLQTALWTSLPAMAGALAGGWLSDRAAARGRPRFDLQIAALLAAAPFLWLLGAAHTLAAASLALAAVGFCRGIYEGTLAVSLYDFVLPRYRSSAAAVVLVLANLLASPSAALLGWFADRAGLSLAVSWLSLFFLASAAVLAQSRGLCRPVANP